MAPPPELERTFEGPEVLEALLRVAGSALSIAEVAARMAQAQSSGLAPPDVIPGLFPHEPRFPSPELARALFGNLLGLWDVVQAGLPLTPTDPVEATVGPRQRNRPEPVEPPTPFGPGGPDQTFVDAAAGYLRAQPRERARRSHSFENRQDALLGALDSLGLADAPDAVARYLLFELHAFLELGWGARVRRMSSADLGTEPDAHLLPPALARHIDEALLRAEQDQEAPLTREQSAEVRRIARAGLWALWRAGSE